MSDKDPYIGETFEDRDSRSGGRRIKITELHPDQWAARHDAVGGRTYRAVRVDEYGRPVGRQRTRIMARTIDAKFRKVSH